MPWDSEMFFFSFSKLLFPIFLSSSVGSMGDRPGLFRASLAAWLFFAFSHDLVIDVECGLMSSYWNKNFPEKDFK